MVRDLAAAVVAHRSKLICDAATATAAAAVTGARSSMSSVHRTAVFPTTSRRSRPPASRLLADFKGGKAKRGQREQGGGSPRDGDPLDTDARKLAGATERILRHCIVRRRDAGGCSGGQCRHGGRYHGEEDSGASERHQAQEPRRHGGEQGDEIGDAQEALEGKVSAPVGHNVVRDVFVGSEAKRAERAVLVCPVLTRAVVLLSSPLLARFSFPTRGRAYVGEGPVRDAVRGVGNPPRVGVQDEELACVQQE